MQKFYIFNGGERVGYVYANSYSDAFFKCHEKYGERIATESRISKHIEGSEMNNKKEIYSVIDGFITELSKKYEIPKSSIYIKQGFNSLRFYSDILYDGSNSEQLLEVVTNE